MKPENDNTGFFAMRVRPGFIGWLLVVFVLVPMLVAILLPTSGGKNKAKSVATRSEFKTIAELWETQHAGSVGLPLSTNGGLLVTLLGNEAKARLSSRLYQTNAEGELLDFWHTRIQFEKFGLSNVVIRSAGPNGKFGDKNDIIFNSEAKNFINP